MTSPTPYRLPANVRPERYRLTLTPNLSESTFQGEESVDIQVVEPTFTITLNAAGLQVPSGSVRLTNGRVVQAQRVTLDEAAETATLSFPAALPRGAATLALSFSGILNDQLRGFYRGQYVGSDGKERYLATTQFEATDARWAFPCWDEPSIKATFQLTLVVPQELAAISNTLPVSETPRGDGTRVVQFAETPKMSTYLLVFIVGDFASVEASAPDGTLVRVWAVRGKEQHGRFALENAINILTYFNDYFGIPYPLQKLDHVAIPDFAAGAMENWGAITYREVALLYDPDNSAASTRQHIVEIVAHEMAHMWFGDLATMAWWDDLWLNESFASWMGDKAVDHLYPEWSMWTQFVFQDMEAGLGLDGLRNSHPIEARVQNPAEIRELFDAISYSKGASILRMLEHFLGAETFRRGLHAYLSVHQYANARTEDLWQALEETSGQPVTALMDTWVKQTGFPLLQVETQRKGRGLNLTIAQRRFLYEHLMRSEEDDTLWQVPVGMLRAGAAHETTSLLRERQASFSLGRGNAPLPQDWVKVNAEQTGFYRVSYPDAEWTRLRAAVEAQQLSPTDRLGLQSDAYALVRAGFATATLFLSLVEAYRNEVDATVWSDLSASLRGLETLIVDQPYLPQFYAFGRELFRPVVQRMGWDAHPGEGHLDALLRSTALAQLGAYEDPQLIREARARFNRYLEDHASLRPDLRGVVFGLVGQEGDRQTYDRLWELEKQATLHEEKMRFLGAVTRFRQKELLQETLRRSLSPDVRSQDTISVIGAVAANRHGREMAWQFVRENWAEFDRRYGRGGFGITRLVGITGAFTTLDRAEEVEQFFRSHPAPSAQRTIQQSVERIRINARWLERNGPELAQWFAAKG